jgi:hypothetical protein
MEVIEGGGGTAIAAEDQDQDQEIGGTLTDGQTTQGMGGQRVVATARLRCLYLVPG